jgi:hypothetical protein
MTIRLRRMIHVTRDSMIITTNTIEDRSTGAIRTVMILDHMHIRTCTVDIYVILICREKLHMDISKTRRRTS